MKRGNEREGSGETIYPKFASSRLATGYTLICPLGNLSTPNAQPLLLASSWSSTSFSKQPLQPRSPPTPFFSVSHLFSRSAKPRSLTGILNTGDSSVFFSIPPISFSLTRTLTHTHTRTTYLFIFSFSLYFFLLPLPFLSSRHLFPSLLVSFSVFSSSVRRLFSSLRSTTRMLFHTDYEGRHHRHCETLRTLPMATMRKHSNLAQPFFLDTRKSQPEQAER